MKSYRFLSLLTLLLVLDIAGLRADAVTPEQATQIASQFFSNKGPRRMQSSARRTSAQSAMTTVAVFDSIDSAGQPYIYAVSAPQQDGFVLVSGDDRFNAVLGYSDGSSYDEQTMPENMRAWMQGYIAEMRHLEAQGYKPSVRKAAAAKSAIEPLLTTKWNQGTPFNNNCPIDNSTQQRSVTGCVATAMAQVINYHIQHYNAPTQIATAIPGYTTYTRHMSVAGIAAGTKLPAASYLIDDYANNAGTDDQKLAVANLMLYCGVAMNMDYTSTGSGVAGSPAQALKTYFGFDSTTRRAERKNFTYQHWMNIIYDELAAGRPVYHSGATATGGHAFVIDGYDGDGLFHVNWGWGGSCDDYFALSVMNPDDNNNIGASTSNDGYTIDQQVVIGVQIGSGESYTEPVLLTMDTYNVNGQNAVFNGANFTGVTHSWTAALAIIDDDGTINQIGGTVPFNLDDGYFSTVELTVPTNTDLAGQTKRIVPVCRLNEEPQGVWHTGPNPDINYWQAVYDANGVPTLTVHPIYNLSGVISVSSNKFVNETQTIQLQVTNSADEFYGQIYLFASTTQDKGSDATQLGLISLAGSTETVQFEWTPTAAGTYNLWVATSSNGSNVIATGSVTIVNDPSLIGKTLVMTAYSFSNTDANSFQIDANGIRSVDVYGNSLTGGVTVKNISNSQFGPLNLGVRFEKYNTSTHQYDSDPVLGYYGNFSLPAGQSVNLGIDRTLETGNTYRIRFLNCSVNPNVELDARYVFHLRTLNNYTISYNLVGGTVDPANPTSYNVLSNAIRLNNPTRTGYTFAGWIGTDLDHPTMTVTIPKGSTGNRSYTATWKLLQLETDDQGNYLIGSKTDWETFCNQVNLDHFSYTGKTIKMTADVGTTLDPVTTMAGDPTVYPKYSFQGTFDGQGHTLTIYYEVTAGYTAPFRVTENATIRNLHVTGSIITSDQMATGFVSEANGTLTIENCRSSVDILSSFEWSGQHAGFVSYSPMMFGEVSCEVTITGCLFDGSIRTTSTTTNCGGFIAVAGGTATIRHSLMAPTSVSEGMVANTFAYGEHLNIDSCYYYGLHVANNQGTAVHRIRVDEDLAINGIAGETAAYDVSGIHISPTGIQAGNTCYAVPDAELSLSLSSTDPSQAVALYVASAGTITAQDANHVTLTMPNSDVDIHAVLALVSAVTWDKTNALRATDAGGICDVTAGQQKTYAGITIAVSGNGYLQADNGNYKLHCENTNDIIFRTDLGPIQRIEVSCSYGGGLEGWTFEQGRAYWTGDANEVVLSGLGTINGITQIVFYVREPVAPASVTTAPTAKTLHYTGAAQELVTAGVAKNGTMQYRVGTNGEWNEVIPTATEIDVYEVYYRAKGDAYHPDGETVGPLVVLLTPALKDTTITITWDTTNVLRMPEKGGIGYVVDNGLEGFGPKTRDNITVIPFWPGNLSPEVKAPPSPPDPTGPYLISIMNSGKLYFATTLGKFTRIEVGPINTLFTPGLSNWTGWEQNDNMVIWTGNTDTVKLIGDGTIREFVKIVFVIEKQEVPGIPASVTTAPADKGLTYNGAAQELVTAGVAKGGTMQYRLGTDGEWGEAIPTGTNAGEYAIYYRVVADTNHVDSEIAGPMVVSIAKAPLTVTAEDKVVVLGDEAPIYTATFDEWLGGDDESVLTGSLSFACAYSAGNQPGTYSITPSGVEAANYSLEFQPGSLIVKDVSLQPIGATFNINGNQVRFAAGNLQYNMTNGSWRFADHQWTIIGAAEGNTSDSGWRDLLDWSTAQSTPFVGWRILSEVECRALIDNRASQLSASGIVHSQAGLILLPDGMTNPPVELNTSATDYTTNSISDENWATLENAGVIFLPVAGYRNGNSVSYLTNGYYWSSSTASDAAQAYYTRIASSYVHGAEYADKSSGYSVRMVTPALPAATLSSAPQAIDGLVYTGAPQALVTAGQAENGVIAYRIGEDGRWSTAIPSATNTGTYFVYYRVIGDTEHSDGEELTVGAVTISNTIPTGIDQATDNPLPVTEKVLIDDQIYILRGGKVYTLQGLEVK